MLRDGMSECVNGLDRSVLRVPAFKGSFTLSLKARPVHSFLIHSFLPHAPHSFIHALCHSCSRGFIHPCPAAIPSPVPVRTWRPAPSVRPRAPRVRPARALRGEPLNQPRLRGAGAGGEPGWGRGAGAPCGKPGGVGEPRPRRLRARSASAGRAQAGGGGGGSGGERRGCPGAMWTGGRRPGRLRRAVSTCEPGGQGAGTGAEAGRAPPTRRGGLRAAKEAARVPPPAGGGDGPASSPPPVALPPVPVRRGPNRNACPAAGSTRGAGRGGDPASARCPAPHAAGLGTWVRVAGSSPPNTCVPAAKGRVGRGRGAGRGLGIRDPPLCPAGGRGAGRPPPARGQGSVRPPAWERSRSRKEAGPGAGSLSVCSAWACAGPRPPRWSHSAPAGQVFPFSSVRGEAAEAQGGQGSPRAAPLKLPPSLNPSPVGWELLP